MKSIIFMIIALLTSSIGQSIHATKSEPFHTAFIAKQNGKVIKSIGDVDAQNPPCSTFKVALALMGFDAGILIDKNTPKWTFKPEYENNFQNWYKPEMGIKYGWYGDHTPETFMQKSVVWFSHQITQRLGKEKFAWYVSEKLRYGNKDVSGTPGKDDGLLNSWLETSLKISPREQMEFLVKLLNNQLDVSVEAQEKTREIMARVLDGQPEEWKGWKLYGKTGGGTGCNRWFIGWVEKGDQKIAFALHIGLTEDTPELRQRAPLAHDVAQKIIEELLPK